jgi:hypothetical protein
LIVASFEIKPREDAMRSELARSRKEIKRRIARARQFAVKFTAWIEGPSTFRIQIVDSSARPRIVRCEQILFDCRGDVTFVGDPETLDQIIIEHQGTAEDVVLVWFFCQDAARGDKFKYEMVEGDSAYIRARAWRGDENPGAVFEQTVTDNSEQEVELDIPSP